MNSVNWTPLRTSESEVTENFCWDRVANGSRLKVIRDQKIPFSELVSIIVTKWTVAWIDWYLTFQWKLPSWCRDMYSSRVTRPSSWCFFKIKNDFIWQMTDWSVRLESVNDSASQLTIACCIRIVRRFVLQSVEVYYRIGVTKCMVNCWLRGCYLGVAYWLD